MVKLEDIIDLMPNMGLYPPDCPVYFNKKSQLDEKIESIEYSKTSHKYEIILKEAIDFDKFEKAGCNFLGNYACGLLGNEKIMYVYYVDVLHPVMSIRDKRKIKFYEDKSGWAVRIIEEYLKEINKTEE